VVTCPHEAFKAATDGRAVPLKGVAGLSSNNFRFPVSKHRCLDRDREPATACFDPGFPGPLMIAALLKESKVINSHGFCNPA